MPLLMRRKEVLAELGVCGRTLRKLIEIGKLRRLPLRGKYMTSEVMQLREEMGHGEGSENAGAGGGDE